MLRGDWISESEDRHTSGTMVQDESIEFKSNRRIKEKFGRKVHVEVTSFNRHVLLTGETASAAVKNEIENIVRAVEGVRDVTNKIVVGEARPLTARSHDAWITSKVKARFVNEGLFQTKRQSCNREWRGLLDGSGGPGGSAKRGEDCEIHRGRPQCYANIRVPGLKWSWLC